MAAATVLVHHQSEAGGYQQHRGRLRHRRGKWLHAAATAAVQRLQSPDVTWE
jgi:hypothetical protein